MSEQKASEVSYSVVNPETLVFTVGGKKLSLTTKIPMKNIIPILNSQKKLASLSSDGAEPDLGSLIEATVPMCEALYNLIVSQNEDSEVTVDWLMGQLDWKEGMELCTSILNRILNPSPLEDSQSQN